MLCKQTVPELTNAPGSTWKSQHLMKHSKTVWRPPLRHGKMMEKTTTTLVQKELESLLYCFGPRILIISGIIDFSTQSMNRLLHPQRYSGLCMFFLLYAHIKTLPCVVFFTNRSSKTRRISVREETNSNWTNGLLWWEILPRTYCNSQRGTSRVISVAILKQQQRWGNI